MSQLLIHWFQFAEIYAVMLVWIVVPLGFYSCFLFFARHYGLFVSAEARKEGDDAAH